MTAYTSTSARRLIAAPLAFGALAIAAVAGDAAFNTTPAAAAAMKFKKLRVDNIDRYRPVVTVRLINGRWQFRTNEKVRFGLKFFAQTKNKRMTSFHVQTGGRTYQIWKGKKTWKLKSNNLRFNLHSSDFASNFGSQVARFCGEKMRGRTGTRNFNINLTFKFYALSHYGQKAERLKSIPSIVKCVS